jgi:hypothetical protein
MCVSWHYPLVLENKQAAIKNNEILWEEFVAGMVLCENALSDDVNEKAIAIAVNIIDVDLSKPRITTTIII